MADACVTSGGQEFFFLTQKLLFLKFLKSGTDIDIYLQVTTTFLFVFHVIFTSGVIGNWGPFSSV